MVNSKAKFNLKQVSSETVSAAFKKIKKKKSSGSDSLTQEQLAFGENVLRTPLIYFKLWFSKHVSIRIHASYNSL